MTSAELENPISYTNGDLTISSTSTCGPPTYSDDYFSHLNSTWLLNPRSPLGIYRSLFFNWFIRVLLA
ncbi:hypothetical protein OPQ81_010245 [Rhizoctonia solani]|nr:hypothetical protein OPQ81_010245 [Rhizoctonia solani]